MGPQYDAMLTHLFYVAIAKMLHAHLLFVGIEYSYSYTAVNIDEEAIML